MGFCTLTLTVHLELLFVQPLSGLTYMIIRHSWKVGVLGEEENGNVLIMYKVDMLD